MQVTEAQEWFHAQLRSALTALYNPPALRKSPLVKVLGLEEKRNPALALQAIILEGIEALRPATAVPAQSDVWRQYQVLRRRYTEQVQQAQVAGDLGLSTRQLQRTESLARAELANYLWHAHTVAARLPAFGDLIDTTPADDLPAPTDDLPAPTDDTPAPSPASWPASSPAQELEYLSRSLSVQEISVAQALADAVATIRPLAAAAGTELYSTAPDHLPLLLVQAPLLHQALVNLACCGIAAAAGGAVAITAATEDRDLAIRISAVRSARSAAGTTASAAQGTTAGPWPVTPAQAGVVQLGVSQAGELIETAGQLVALCGGRLTTGSGSHQEVAVDSLFFAELVLPALASALVLVVDDNLDTQQLYSRLLAGSRYRLASALNGSTGLAMALASQPQVILLDVMMPDKDGWTLLGQLREHPATRAVPVIVCSILPQEQLALALGAAEFLRKPLSREALLAALHRQLVRPDGATAS
jgi:CheY-like chemotaxis protein